MVLVVAAAVAAIVLKAPPSHASHAVKTSKLTSRTTPTTQVKTASAPAAASVSITSPTSGTVIDAESVTISGTMTPADAKVQIQGRTVASGNGSFAGNARIHSGTNIIGIIVSAAGHSPGTTTMTLEGQTSGGPEGVTKSEPKTTATTPPPDRPDGLIVQFGAYTKVSDAQSLVSRLAGQGVETQIINSDDYTTSPAAPLGLWLVITKNTFSDSASADGYAASSGVKGAFPRTVTPH